MSTIDIIKDTEPITEQELFSEMFPAIEEAWYFVSTVDHINNPPWKQYPC